MLDLEENKRFLNTLQNRLQELESALQISNLTQELAELESQTMGDDFWEDSQKSSVIYSKMNVIQKKIKTFETLKTELDNLIELNDLLILEQDKDLEKDLLINTQKLEKSLEEIEVQTLLSGKYDVNNAILTIHPGARAGLNHKIGLKCFTGCIPDGLQQINIWLRNWIIWMGKKQA